MNETDRPAPEVEGRRWRMGADARHGRDFVRNDPGQDDAAQPGGRRP